MRRPINKCEIEVLYKYRALIRKQHDMVAVLPESPKAETYEVELDPLAHPVRGGYIRVGTLRHMKEYYEKTHQQV